LVDVGGVAGVDDDEGGAGEEEGCGGVKADAAGSWIGGVERGIWNLGNGEGESERLVVRGGLLRRVDGWSTAVRDLPPVMRATLPSREKRSAMGGMSDMLAFFSDQIFEGGQCLRR
jgi:hypothetical protein